MSHYLEPLSRGGHGQDISTQRVVDLEPLSRGERAQGLSTLAADDLEPLSRGERDHGLSTLEADDSEPREPRGDHAQGLSTLKADVDGWIRRRDELDNEFRVLRFDDNRVTGSSARLDDLAKQWRALIQRVDDFRQQQRLTHCGRVNSDTSSSLYRQVCRIVNGLSINSSQLT